MDWISACSTDQATGNCIEVRPGFIDGEGDGVAFRDSKDPEGPVLIFTADEFREFLAGAKAGKFDDLA